jgi:hypothetical protein
LSQLWFEGTLKGGVFPSILENLGFALTFLQSLPGGGKLPGSGKILLNFLFLNHHQGKESSLPVQPVRCQKGETFEFKKMYPEMLTKAKANGIQEAEMSFDFANQVEKIHATLYEKALANLGKNEAVDYYVCPVCGNTGSNFMKVS